MIVDKVFSIGRAQYGAGSSLGPRNTIGFEFVRVLQGNVTWIYDDCTYLLKPGDWVLSQPEHREHYIWDKNGATLHDHIHFTLVNTDTLLSPFTEWPTVSSLDSGNVMQALFEHIIQLHKSDHKQRIKLMKHAVQHMLNLWVNQAFAVSALKVNSFSSAVQKVVNETHTQWNNGNIKPLNMNDMVRIACISRSSFLRTFQSELQDTPSRFFERQRLQLGRLHLLKTNRSIEQIAYLLGYSSPFHFSKNFKQYFGCAPRDFKRKGQPEQLSSDDYLFQQVFNLLSATQTL